MWFMENENKLSRRRFAQLAVLGTGSLFLAPRCSGSIPNWRFFTDEEAVLMDALADQIIPPDEWPGGREAGVTNFIDKQLVGPYTRFQEKYRKGLLSVQATCKVWYSKKFEELEWNDQMAFLEKMEAGELKTAGWAKGFDSEFFNLFRDHCMQAYYGSPRHGGNKSNISYKMLQLDYPLVVGQNRYKS